MKKSAIHSGVGITPDGAVDAVLAGLLAVRGLVEPLVVGRLLGAPSAVDRLRVWNSATPHGLIVVAQGAGLHPRPLAVDDRPGVADELARQLAAHGRREELRRLELLRDGQRLGLGARSSTGRSS